MYRRRLNTRGNLRRNGRWWIEWWCGYTVDLNFGCFATWNLSIFAHSVRISCVSIFWVCCRRKAASRSTNTAESTDFLFIIYRCCCETSWLIASQSYLRQSLNKIQRHNDIRCIFQTSQCLCLFLLILYLWYIISSIFFVFFVFGVFR